MHILVILLNFTVLQSGSAMPATPAAFAFSQHDHLHASFDSLLHTYVDGFGVRYSAWAADATDRGKLQRYLDRLAQQRIDGWPADAQLAFWINLYNAATLNLILDNYPTDSIKKLGALFSSPWKRKIITVAGRDLSLDDVEHNIIRKQFDDARIHFALNCAAVSCPPLAPFAFLPSKLDEQLDAVSAKALQHERWLEIGEDEIRVSKIFDWYKGDFEAYSGSVRRFIARYRPEQQAAILDESKKLKIMNYDWSLNEARPDSLLE